MSFTSNSTLDRPEKKTIEYSKDPENIHLIIKFVSRNVSKDKRLKLSSIFWSGKVYLKLQDPKLFYSKIFLIWHNPTALPLQTTISVLEWTSYKSGNQIQMITKHLARPGQGSALARLYWSMLIDFKNHSWRLEVLIQEDMLSSSLNIS